MVIKMGIDYEKIGLRISYIRKEAKIKQKDLAAEMNISQKYLSCLETGRKHVNLELLSELCSIFDSTFDYFLLGYIRQAPEENIWDLLKLCSEEDKETVYELVKYLAQRNQK